MKILIVTNLYPPNHIGGYELACRDTVALLEESGHECRVLTSNFGSSDSDVSVVRKMLLHHAWGTDYPEASFSSAQCHNAECLRREISDFAPDLVYAWNLYGLGWKLLTECTGPSTPPVTFHFMDWSVMAYQSTPKRILSSALGRIPNQWGNIRSKVRNAIFISRFTREQLGVGAQNSCVLYPFLDVAAIPAKTNYRLGNPVRSVFVGQIEIHKGVFFLCQTLDEFRKRSGIDIRLDVYGLSRTGKDISLSEQYSSFVTVKRNVDRKSLLNGLKDYDLGFFPSLWEEPFGIAQIEMMAAGLPVISSGRGGAREVFRGENLLLYPHDNQDAFTEVLQGIVGDYQYQGRLIGIEARRYVEENHTRAAHIKELNEHIKGVCSARATD